MPDETSKPLSLPWDTPLWARAIIQMTQEVLWNQQVILKKEGNIMALTDDLKNQIAALQASDGTIITVLNDLSSKAQQNGSVSDADVQSAISQIQSEISNLSAAAQAADPSFVPPSA